MNEDPLTTIGHNLGFKELELLGKIRSADSAEKREQLIVELEATPEQIHPYYSRWLVLHDVAPFHCWTDAGYDPCLSDVPRDIQLLAATRYGISDINNGGLYQFFSNGTGSFAPEMVEWFERAGIPDGASHMREAIKVFGTEFPRSQKARQEFLDQFSGEEREEWDPFHELDGPFYDSVSGTGLEVGVVDKYVAPANRWLKLTCGIANLRMTYNDAEQAGTGQPATRFQSKSEGSDKPQPESEGRSR